MRTLSFPTDQILKYFMTGKFKAPSEDWKHENFYLGEYELFVMTEGILYLNYNNENFTVKSGEYLLLPPCNAWRKGFKSAYCSFYWLHFTVEESCLSSTDLPQYTIAQTGIIPKPDKLTVLMKQLQDSVKNKYPALVLNAMTTTIMAELYGQLSFYLPSSSISTEQKQVYLDIIDYVNLHINENIKVSEIAASFGYNSKYLSHLFAEVTGTPLKQYILQQKVDAANFILADTNKSIAEIAAELGFSDPHNFARTYKKVTGLTPSDYRNAFAKRLLYNV